MDGIRINTTQNVALRYTSAGIGLRILAGLLDMLFILSYVLIVFFIFSYALRKREYSEEIDRYESYNQVVQAFYILALLPAMLYNLLCETFLNGQSFGKKIVKIKVVKLNGTQPNFSSYLIRSMFRIIDRPLIALITIAVSKNSQRFGDMVAGTTVIQINRPVSIRETILHRQKPDYSIVYPQVSLLSDADASTIQEVLRFSIEQEQPQHLALLAEKIRKKYGISDAVKNERQFLQTLLLDYSHYQFEK
jgi:uncharacterized RDD family membrane protein YckC